MGRDTTVITRLGTIEVLYTNCPKSLLPLLRQVTETLIPALGLDRSYQSLRIRVVPKLNARADVQVVWPIHHAKLRLLRSLLQPPTEHRELIQVLLHEMIHMLTWEWAEQVEMVETHIPVNRRSEVVKKFDEGMERVVNHLTGVFYDLLERQGMLKELLGDNGTLGSPSGL